MVEPNISIRNQDNRFEERKGDVVIPDISIRDLDLRYKGLVKEGDSDYIRDARVAGHYNKRGLRKKK